MNSKVDVELVYGCWCCLGCWFGFDFLLRAVARFVGEVVAEAKQGDDLLFEAGLVDELPCKAAKEIVVGIGKYGVRF
jgi:hypothetical protein